MVKSLVIAHMLKSVAVDKGEKKALYRTGGTRIGVVSEGL
jgi:hypothetical protein